MALVNNNSAYKERNLEFLDEYAQRPGVKRLFNGVLYREITQGRGDRPTVKSVVTVHYKGMLINGKCFDATEKGRPATFPLRGLIEGWKTALKEMPVGSRWEVVIPFNLGYGARGAGVIKPFSTLIFDITLLRVE
ncbi:MAG: FKBP-type peptidyl-prolyl cis-trans isomerase [Tidjanibacter sp.]|nr:FKBP-type peptidyl-prolyl cis-trans isomerase [Tidjanibacter sp.]